MKSQYGYRTIEKEFEEDFFTPHIEGGVFYEIERIKWLRLRQQQEKKSNTKQRRRTHKRIEL